MNYKRDDVIVSKKDGKKYKCIASNKDYAVFVHYSNKNLNFKKIFTLTNKSFLRDVVDNAWIKENNM